MFNREDKIRRTDEVVSRVISLWPIWCVVAGGIFTSINLYHQVTDLIADQKAWKVTIEERRSKTHDDLESIRNRLTRLETDDDWLKGRSHGLN